MTIYLPKPYPDELLYSVIARYVAYAGIRHICALKKILVGGQLNPFLPRGLSILSQRTWAVWNMTPEEIARRLTMYPYYTAFSNGRKEALLLDGLLSTTTPAALLRYLVSRLVPKSLRYCEVCSKKDFEKYGETYWRRIHQMQGVAVCPKHGEELIAVPLTDQTTGADFVNATKAIHIGLKPSLKLAPQEKIQLLAIARRCRKMLHNQLEPQWRNADLSLYRKMAMEKGLCRQLGNCSHEITMTFRKMYSDQIIQTFGLNHFENTISKIFFTPYNGALQPVARAVLQEFLSAIPENHADSINFGYGPWKCPNPFGQHTRPFPIKKVAVHRDKRKAIFARTTCCCGYGFEFYSTDPTDPSMPLVHKVTTYGPSWEEAINSLHDAGMDATAIALTLKIPTKTVRQVSEYSKLEHSITSLRRQWNDLLNATKHHTVTEARKRNPHLYTKIKELDPNYISCRRGYNASSRHSKAEKYYIKKDAVLSGTLRRAAESILNDIPPVRVSLREVLRRSGTSSWSIRHDFQKCHQALREVCETSLEFQMRRLKYLAEKAKAQGIQPRRNQLFYEGNIRGRKHKELLENYVDSLCE